ncbi:MAG: nickel-dependent lactate racemase [Anaerolineae bacterium]|nr:nickel-dependent lactate racemase [Anaerolineae bacterium]
MKIQLAYGKTGLAIELPDHLDVTVVEPKFVPGLSNPARALRAALQSPLKSPPLRNLVKPTDTVGIVFCDITRPAPSHLMIPALLEELRHVPGQNITLFNATGTHRPNTGAELRAMLGDELVDTYRLVQNDAFDPSSQVHLGTTSRGNDIWLNREFVACNKKILTGFIEPHFFAGFSGGGKIVMPGMAGQQTVLRNHDATMLKDVNTTWGVTWGNPLWEEVQEVALKVNPTFILHVSLNKDKKITNVFAGNLETAHAAGCAFVNKTAMALVPHPFDIVITTNSGYPLDLNLYQAVKGMSAAGRVVKKGGSIIVAADCWDGIPDHGLYGQLLRQASSPQELLATISAPGFLQQDQWQAQIQAQIQLKADVYLHTSNLTDAQIEAALLKPSHSIEATVAELLKKYGPNASICGLPEGPQTIPYLQK